MNPLTPAARWRQMDREVRAIRAAWPEAVITWSSDYLTAHAVIYEPASTTLVEVTPEGTSSLHVPHARGGHSPEWRDGWND